MALEFNYVKDNQYNITKTTYVVEHVNEILDTISCDKSKYADVINSTLFNSILSRLVAAEFIAQYIDIMKSNPYVVIKVIIDDKVVHCTVGVVTVESEEKYINGVLNV